MKIIPFRIKPSKEENNFAEIYEFIIKGKDTYQVEIEIDNLNNLGITDTRCTCPHFKFRQTECKHINQSKKILSEFGVTEIKQESNKW